MIRNDGNYKIYLIKHFSKDYPAKGKDTWVTSSLDHFFVRQSDINGSDLKELTPENRDFLANGECWQKTGISGTFDRNVALRFKEQLQKKYPERQFSVFELVISQSQQMIS